MDAVSYPNPKVIDLFDENLIAVKVLINSQPRAKKFRVQWTPTLVLLDAEGEEHNRTVGFLPPEELPRARAREWLVRQDEDSEGAGCGVESRNDPSYELHPRDKNQLFENGRAGGGNHPREEYESGARRGP